MRRFASLLNLVIILAFGLTVTSCHNRTKSNDENQQIALNEETVTAFAKDIIKGIQSGDAEALNKAIDKEYVKQLVCENSIVYSGFDVEGGKEYFENCLRLGDRAVNAVNNGGDYAFVRYYVKDNQHHVIMREYLDFTIDFTDFIVDTVKGKLMLKDGFQYSAGCNLSKDIESRMLYNLMLQTNPESDVKFLQEADQLAHTKQYAKSLNVLKEHKDALKDYTQYYQLLIANLSQLPGNFTAELDTYKEDIDARTLLLHKLLYRTFQLGRKDQQMLAEYEDNINALIDHTGDDPIYLFLYGYKAENINRQDAITCYKSVEKAMPMFWDLWERELRCYQQEGDSASYKACLEKGKSAFALSDEEIRKMNL